MKKIVFIAIISILSLRGQAMDCRPMDGASGGFACDEENPGLMSQIKIRPMPGFTKYGGLTLIDICQFPYEMEGEEEFTLGTDEANANEVPVSCIRRYCSRDGRSLSIIVGSKVIPIGTFGFVGFQLAVKKDHFQINCQNIPELEVK